MATQFRANLSGTLPDRESADKARAVIKSAVEQLQALGAAVTGNLSLAEQEPLGTRPEAIARQSPATWASDEHRVRRFATSRGADADRVWALMVAAQEKGDPITSRVAIAQVLATIAT